MYATFDYRCKRSGEIVSKFVKKIDMDDQKCSCGEHMVRLPAAPPTTFKFADRKLK